MHYTDYRLGFGAATEVDDRSLVNITSSLGIGLGGQHRAITQCHKNLLKDIVELKPGCNISACQQLLDSFVDNVFINCRVEYVG